MRVLVAVLMTLPLMAQTPAPVAEEWVSGTAEVGNRWISGVAGSYATYRGMVNLGQGPKLFGLDLSFKDPTHHLFDKLTVRASSWGGDPYNTARIDAARDRLYKFTFDYRNISYFNAMPSYADPGLATGLLVNQRSFDVQRRMVNTELDLFPTSRVIPYVAYTRDRGQGSGITDFTTDSNEYAVGNTLFDKTDHYRGGVRLEFRRFHATLEEGGTAFKDDQRLYQSGGNNRGDRTTPIFGQLLSLSTLNQAYGVRGNSTYSQAQFTANPFSWMNLYGQWLYSRPTNNVNYSQSNTGNFISLDTLAFFTAEQALLVSQTQRPHSSGSFSAELKPLRRLRVFESVMMDRFNTTGTLVAASDVVTPGGSTAQGATTLQPLELHYNRQETIVMFDVTSKLTLRGGQRYVWGDSVVRAPNLSQLGDQEQGQLKMNVGLAGMTFRTASRFSFNFDFESASDCRSYFRTGLENYQKARIRAKFQALTSLSFNTSFSLLNNENPTPGVGYQFLSRDNSISAQWSPRGGRRMTLVADYTRSTLRSDLSYLVPSTLKTADSLFRENAHVGTALLDLTAATMHKAPVKFSLGGSLFVSAGTRPTKYYQPIGRVSIPLHTRATLFSEWRWYNLGERTYLYEGFRTHQFVVGLRLGM